MYRQVVKERWAKICQRNLKIFWTATLNRGNGPEYVNYRTEWNIAWRHFARKRILNSKYQLFLPTFASEMENFGPHFKTIDYELLFFRLWVFFWSVVNSCQKKDVVFSFNVSLSLFDYSIDWFFWPVFWILIKFGCQPSVVLSFQCVKFPSFNFFVR